MVKFITFIKQVLNFYFLENSISFILNYIGTYSAKADNVKINIKNIDAK